MENEWLSKNSTHGGQTKKRGETERPKQMAKNKRDGYLRIYVTHFLRFILLIAIAVDN